MTDDYDEKYADRAPATEADSKQKAEIDRIDGVLKAEEERLAAAYNRAPARSGGPAHIARPMARR